MKRILLFLLMMVGVLFALGFAPYRAKGSVSDLAKPEGDSDVLLENEKEQPKEELPLDPMPDVNEEPSLDGGQISDGTQDTELPPADEDEEGDDPTEDPFEPPLVSVPRPPSAEPEPEPEPEPKPHIDDTVIKVYISDSKTVLTMTLGDYIVGAMMKELGLGYEREALRAQAIAIRSYILYKIERGYYHASGAVTCDDINHCMAYMTEAEAVKRYGAENAAYRRSCYQTIVSETAGQVVKYKGETIQAFFHSSSNGATESCKDAWGGSRPYLQSVTSEEICKETVKYFTLTQLAKSLNLSTAAFSTGNVAIGKVEYTESGRVARITIYGKVIDGSDLRTALDLASTSFTVTYENGKFKFTVKGSGHGVGMSQLGADAMAARGCTATEILMHYYTDCTVEEYTKTI